MRKEDGEMTEIQVLELKLTIIVRQLDRISKNIDRIADELSAFLEQPNLKKEENDNE